MLYEVITQSEADEGENLLPPGAVESAEHPERAVMRVVRNVHEQHGQLNPDHDGRCKSASASTQCGQTQVTEHEHVIQRNIEQGADNPVNHGRPCMAGAFTEKPQQQHEAKSGCAP